MIRKAIESDLLEIMEIYKTAREFMKNNGNPTQWGDKYPDRDMLILDISKEQLYIYEENGTIHGVFAFIIGEDETYKVITDGEWLNNSIYGTIHRIASDGKIKGLFNKTVDYCFNCISHLRIDTHYDNRVMQHLIEKNGFINCGTIYVSDGSPRIAYEKFK